MEGNDLDKQFIKVPRFKISLGYSTSKKYSSLMSRIKSENSKPEMLLRKAMWANNIRYRIHVKGIPGKPDIMIKKFKLIIFIDGEFWHGYQWADKKLKIKSNRSFWIPKIERNIQNDILINKRLTALGYTVFRFWGRDIIKELPKCLNQIMLYIETAKSIKIPDHEDLGLVY